MLKFFESISLMEKEKFDFFGTKMCHFLRAICHRCPFSKKNSKMRIVKRSISKRKIISFTSPMQPPTKNKQFNIVHKISIISSIFLSFKSHFT